MSFQVTTAHVVKFQNNVQLALQQRRSKLAQYSLQQSPSGKNFELTNLIGSVLPNEATVRHGATKYVNTPHGRRWMPKPPELYYADLVDTADRLQAGIDLQGSYVMAGAATCARARDIRWLQGFYGNNLAGETGTDVVGFNAANIVPVNTGAAVPTGMNVAKLRAAQKILRKNQVDLEAEECFMALTAEQVDDLQSQVEVISSDFNRTDAPVLREGRLVKLLGFSFIEMEFGDQAAVGPEVSALTLDASNYRRVPFWCRSGMAYGEWGSAQTIDRLPQLQNSVQIYAGITCNAARTEEGKCGQVLCDES